MVRVDANFDSKFIIPANSYSFRICLDSNSDSKS